MLASLVGGRNRYFDHDMCHITEFHEIKDFYWGRVGLSKDVKFSLGKWVGSRQKNYSKSDIKSRQQCWVRDQEYIIICILILLRFETSVLRRYKYNKHAYPLRFVTSSILLFLSLYIFSGVFDKAHIRIWGKTVQYWSINAYAFIVGITICAICVLWLSKQLTAQVLSQNATWGVFHFEDIFESPPCCSTCNLHIYTRGKRAQHPLHIGVRLGMSADYRTGSGPFIRWEIK